ncbi:MAG: glutamyl-tRNA reductase [Desulfovibrionales bacterium]
MDQEIVLVGLNHRTADVEVREKFAVTSCAPVIEGLVRNSGHIQEALVLSTCNRVEFLVVGDKDVDLAEEVLSFWSELSDHPKELVRPHIYVHKGLDAVAHMFTVASSLDSMILGEPQILGQLKDAYRQAVKSGSARVIVNRILHKSFSVAKRVRTETGVSASAVSVSYAAVELAKHIFGDLSQQKAMLVGAGEMAELAAMHLLGSGVSEIVVANRTYERGLELAEKFAGRAIPFDTLFERLHEADIVITSTGALEPVVRLRDMKPVLKRRKNRPMFFIDIAVPRDIDPDVNRLDNVYLYDIDDLKEVIEENLAQRQEEALKGLEIVKEEVEKFEQWLRALDLHPTIKDLLSKAETIARRELRKSYRNLGEHDTPEVRAVLETLALSLSRKLSHEPIDFLKRKTQEEGSAKQYVHLARRIFNLDGEQIPEDAHQDRKQKKDT